jgi:hypothetical protein
MSRQNPLWQRKNHIILCLWRALKHMGSLQMKALLLAAAVMCALGMPWVDAAQAQPGAPGNPGGPGAPGAPGGQPQASPTFAFSVCNKGGVGDAYISLLYGAPNGYRAQGWWKVAQGQCTNVGSFNRPAVYMFAMAGQYTWSKQDTTQCVNMTAGFDYTMDGRTPHQCTAGEELKGFVKIEVEPRYGSMEFSLN